MAALTFDHLVPKKTGGPLTFDHLIPQTPADPAVPTQAQIDPEAKANATGGPLRYLDNLVRQGANAASFGLADEFSAFMSNLTGIGPTANAPSYDAALGQERARDKGFEQSNPIAATGSQIAGALVSPAPGLSWAARAPTMLGKMGRSAVVAAPMGAATGFGQGEGGIENRLEKAKSDGMLAAGIGGLLPPVAIGTGKTADFVKRLAEPFTEAGRQKAAARQLGEGVTGIKSTAADHQPAVQKAIENIDAAQAQAAQINEPLGYFEGLAENLLGRGLVRAGDQWIDPATKQVVMKPYQPTTGVAVGTTQALGAEQKARLQSPAPFIERDNANNSALTAVLNTLDSGETGKATSAAANLVRQQDDIAAQAATKAQQAQQEAVQKAQSSTGRSYEDIGTSTYNTVRDEYLQPARKRKNELYGQVPNEVVPGSASMRDTAKGVINGIETPPAPAQAILNLPERPSRPPRYVGTSLFGGDAYEGPKGADAVKMLMERKTGEVKGALFHPDLGDIDLPWGHYDAAADKGAGLAKLVQKHPEVVGDLDGIIGRLPLARQTPSRVWLEDGQYMAVVSLDHNGAKKQWLLTAFEKKPKGSEGGAQGSRYVPPEGYAPDRTVSSSQEGAPSAAHNTAGDLTSQELMTIRREAIRTMRQSANSDPIKAQKAAELAGTASRLLYGDASPEAVRSTLKAADDFYKGEFLPKFRQGPGKQIATRGPNGEEARMPPSRGLVSWIKPDTQKGAAEAADQFRRIVGDDKAVVQNVQDHFFNLAAQKAIRKNDGSVDPQAIRKIITDHRAALERFPDVRKDLVRAANLASDAAKQAKVAEELTAGAEAYRKSAIGKVADADPDRIMGIIMNQSNPAEAARQTKTALAEAGPEAVDGFKQAITDKLREKFATATKAGNDGDLKLSIAQIEREIGKNGKQRRMLEVVYTPTEMRLMDNVRAELQRVAQLGRRATTGSPTAENFGLMSNQTLGSGLVRMLSLGTAAQSGFLAGLGVELVAGLRKYRKDQIAAIVTEGMLNPDVAKIMMKRELSRAEAQQVIRIFDRIANNAPRAALAAAVMTD